MRRFRVTTRSNPTHPIAPNLLERRFAATAVDRIWLGDIIYLSTDEGWFYLAALLDTCSRKVVGWATSERFATAGVVVSMSRRGDCWDNAMMESFFKTLKAELGEDFATRADARRELFDYIEGLTQHRRLHSSLDYRSQAEFERLAGQAEAEA